MVASESVTVTIKPLILLAQTEFLGRGRQAKDFFGTAGRNGRARHSETLRVSGVGGWGLGVLTQRCRDAEEQRGRGVG